MAPGNRSLQINTITMFLSSLPAHLYYVWEGEECMKLSKLSKDYCASSCKGKYN